MCTVVVLRRPDDDWPLLLAANRDERTDRPWRAPGRHWPDRPNAVAGIDELAGGSWLGLNDEGVVAGVLNRRDSPGPDPGLRSRGELVLEALDHADAVEAASALGQLDGRSYRSFNMVIADDRDAYWLRSADPSGGRVEVRELPDGISMITAQDRNDAGCRRTRRYLPLFEAAAAPDPGQGDWRAWRALLGDRRHDEDAGPGGAMRIVADRGFGTLCSSLIALPGAAQAARPVFLFADLFAGAPPGGGDFQPVA